MKNRTEINLIAFDSGRAAAKIGEIALEKRYCEEHGYSVGDTIKIEGKDFEIVGIGTVPDYDMPTANFSDMAVESELFGIAFVTSEQYGEILKNRAQKAENYTYAYLLENNVTHKELKQKIKDLDFDFERVDDKYFRETISESLEKRNELKNGVNELNSGAKALRDTLKTLAENMVVMMISVSAVIFFTVMYLMTGVMIDRSSFGISLIKVFGFRSKEVRRLYLNGNTAVVSVGAVIEIPLSKAAMDAIYPWAVANTACGMNLRFEWYAYPLIFAGIMLVYFTVNAFLVRKINKITPAEVLKNRE